MANIYEGMNVRQKLSKARLYFLNQKVKKTGKNMSLEFKYFELEDIVPAATRIFARVGLVHNTVFDGEKATMTIYNTDNRDEPGIEFVLPYRDVGQIVSNKGKEVTNAMQALGSSTTYLRRYLWMMAMDITEPDDIDPNLTADDTEDEEEISSPAPAEKKKEKKDKPKPPATPVEREAAKKDLTDTDGNADELQIAALKAACKQLMEKDPEQEDFVQQIAMKTNGMTTVSRAACEQLINNLSEMVAAYE